MRAIKIDENTEDLLKPKDVDIIIEDYITNILWDKSQSDIHDILVSIHNKKISIEKNSHKIEETFLNVFKNILSYTIDTWSL